MPSLRTNTNTQALLTGALTIAFMLAGMYFGIRPEAANAGTFGDVLLRFAHEPQTKSIIAAILLDVVTGVVAAYRVKTFDGQAFAGFMRSNVVPYVFGYMIYWFLTYYGLTDQVTPEVSAALSNFGFGAVMSSLSMSVVDNATRARAGSSRPADVDEVMATPAPDGRG